MLLYQEDPTGGLAASTFCRMVTAEARGGGSFDNYSGSGSMAQHGRRRQQADGWTPTTAASHHPATHLHFRHQIPPCQDAPLQVWMVGAHPAVNVAHLREVVGATCMHAHISQQAAPAGMLLLLHAHHSAGSPVQLCPAARTGSSLTFTALLPLLLFQASSLPIRRWCHCTLNRLSLGAQLTLTR